MKGSYLGPEFNDAEIEAELKACGAAYTKRSENDLIDEIAEALANEKAIMDAGRMEFGQERWVGEVLLPTPVHLNAKTA